MGPLKISAETALILSETLKLPLEQIMHMPQHILLAKMAEAQKSGNNMKEK
ncbi:YycC family protein [Peribacillus sp. SCS-155]|uniref:YycC family protein n=1 Tax=Peribacillus sedimenti TaxID=3115297 RepID=UPI003906A9C0